VENYRHRVLYGDTDQMGVVYYANYLRFFEGARNEWIRSLGLTYAQIEERGIMLPVFEASIQYLKPARYDDLLDIKIVATHTRVKIRFEYKVHRVGGGAGSAGDGRSPQGVALGGAGSAGDGRSPQGVALGGVVLALGHTVHACVGRDGRPTRAPDWLLGALEAAGLAGGRAEPRSGGALEEAAGLAGGRREPRSGGAWEEASGLAGGQAEPLSMGGGSKHG
jgi:acyl-CoA thioester hydrolase